MISHELSMIQMNEPLRAQLAANIEAYLSVGGTIQVEEPRIYSPPPIRHEPPPSQKSQTIRRAIPVIPIDKMTEREIERELRAQEKIDLAERIRKLAESMTQSEVATHLGLNRRKLLLIAKTYGFEFKKSKRVGPSNFKNAYDAEQEAQAVAKIKECLELGLSKHAAIKRIRISWLKLSSLIKAHGIDYPLAVN